MSNIKSVHFVKDVPKSKCVGKWKGDELKSALARIINSYVDNIIINYYCSYVSMYNNMLLLPFYSTDGDYVVQVACNCVCVQNRRRTTLILMSFQFGIVEFTNDQNSGRDQPPLRD